MGVHDLQAAFSSKGSRHEPMRILEVRNHEFGSHLLRVDPMMALMMPCKIAVYMKNGKTYIGALRPRSMGDYIPQLEPLAEQGDSIMHSIVEEAR